MVEEIRRGLAGWDTPLLQRDIVVTFRSHRSLDRLLSHKDALEAHLAKRCGELFAVENEVLLYDVTSTYFEGEAEGIEPDNVIEEILKSVQVEKN